MSDHPNYHDDDVPRFEPWLGVMASAILPPILALYVHARFLVPLIAAAVALLLTGIVMLRRQTVRRRLDRQTPPP
jgi:hypothetical protein